MNQLLSALLAKKKTTIYRPQRTYEPIWKRLKLHRTVSLKVAPHLVRRVVKAVVKEKDRDVAFKFQQEQIRKEKKLFLRSKYDSTEWRLELTLVPTQRITLEDL